jgi:glycine cleavage system H protein
LFFSPNSRLEPPPRRRKGLDMNEMRYTADHEWLRVEDDGSITVGITHHAQEQLGDLVFVQLPEVGRQYAKDDEAAVIESVKAAAEIKMPVSGTVVAVNTRLVDEPGMVNTDPLGAGWFFRLTTAHPTPLAGLMDAAAYDAWVSNT